MGRFWRFNEWRDADPAILLVVTLLQVQNLSKRFGKIAALDGVSLEVHSGEVLGLIGPNGAGKSTLFDCLAGLSPADSGSITLPAHPQSEIHAQVFYLPDGITPYPEQPLGWILDFAVGFYRGRGELLPELVEQLSLGPCLKQPLGKLSKGQRKRGLLALGLLTPQPLLLIDEPLDGLDLRQMRETAGVLRAHASRGRTLFLSIHQISDAAQLCDRFVLLSGGKSIAQGTLAELSAQASHKATLPPSPSLEEVFLALT